MDPVRLEHPGPEDLRHEPGADAADLLAEPVEDGPEPLPIGAAVVAGEVDLDQHHLRPLFSSQRCHGGQVLPDLGRGKAPQPVVAAELEDHDLWAVALEESWKAHPAAEGGLPAPAGVDHPKVGLLEARLEQGDPPLCGIEAVAGAQAVPEDQDRFRLHRLK